MENENPFISTKIIPQFDLKLEDGMLVDITKESIFQLIRSIKDPEHPYTLEQLNIVGMDDIHISSLENPNVLCKSGQPIQSIEVIFTPTVPHCSMAGIIGLCLHYQLKMYVKNHLINVNIKKDTHSTYQSLNKQLSDRDRVMAAFDNDGMVDVIKSCIDSE
jgi:hypothetical protein